MLGPPCASFSIARDRTLQIRSKDQPYGLPGLSPEMQKVVDTGNTTALAAAKICRWLYNARVPFILENPHSSRIWYLDEYLKLAGLTRVEVVVADYCQFGTKCRKRTRFLCSDICECDLSCLKKQCNGRGWCSRTGCAHQVLEGNDSHGRKWTKLAEPYPHRLCNALIHCLTAHRQY